MNEDHGSLDHLEFESVEKINRKNVRWSDHMLYVSLMMIALQFFFILPS